MAGNRMVPLTTVTDAFQAKVLAARLGASGIVTSLRGSVDGPYPFGEVVIDVLADEADVARQLLLADEVESVFDIAVHGTRRVPWWRNAAAWVVAGSVVAGSAVAGARRFF